MCPKPQPSSAHPCPAPTQPPSKPQPSSAHPCPAPTQPPSKPPTLTHTRDLHHNQKETHLLSLTTPPHPHPLHTPCTHIRTPPPPRTLQVKLVLHDNRFFLESPHPPPRTLQVKLVLHDNRFFLESPHPAVLRTLLADPVIAEARAVRAVGGSGGPGGGGGSIGGGAGAGFDVSLARRDAAVAELAAVETIDLEAAGGEEDAVGGE